MVWMVSTSLKTEFAAIQQPPHWIPAEPTFEQYTTLLSPANRHGQQFLGYLRNSIWVSMATTVLGVLVAVPAAYAFSRFTFPGREPLFFSVLVRNMFPVVVFLIPLFILMKRLGLIDTHLSLILTYLTFGLPLSIWLLKGLLRQHPAGAGAGGADRRRHPLPGVLDDRHAALDARASSRPRSTPSSRAGTSTSTPAPSSTRKS